MLAFLIAYLLDLYLGDPKGWPHPVRLLGRWISLWEKLLYQPRVGAGVVFWLAVMATVGALTALVWHLLAVLSPLAMTVISIYLIYSLLATRSLHVESLAVEEAMAAGNLEEARRRLGLIVGRDTMGLSETDIRRAVLETVAENLSDGVVAPMFYLAWLGIPGMLLYKTANTMDSMVGYKNERYLFFGRAAARLDDVLNYLPARLTGVLLVASAALGGLNWLEAWRTMRRDASKASSPNAGWPEAALAGALGVRLGGPSSYFGVRVEKPYIGEGFASPSPANYPQAVRLLYTTSLIMAALVLLVLYLRKADIWLS